MSTDTPRTGTTVTITSGRWQGMTGTVRGLAQPASGTGVRPIRVRVWLTGTLNIVAIDATDLDPA